MVTNRDKKSFGSRRKNSKLCSDDWHRWRFWYVFRHFGTHFAESFRMSKSSWMMDPPHSREMPSCSAIDLAEIRRSSKISSWIWSIISWVVNVLGRSGRSASQVEKSPRLNWATQFLTVAYDDACSPNVSVRMAWISFGALPCRKKRNWWQLVSPSCWNRARHLTCFLSASVTRNYLQFGTRRGPSFQRHYRFHPTTFGSRSDYGLISTPSSNTLFLGGFMRHLNFILSSVTNLNCIIFAQHKNSSRSQVVSHAVLLRHFTANSHPCVTRNFLLASSDTLLSISVGKEIKCYWKDTREPVGAQFRVSKCPWEF